MGRKQLPAEQAEAELREFGYEPEEPYPGVAAKPWRVRCTGCGHPRLVRLTLLRKGERCSHRTPPVSEEQAREELKAAGFELVSGWTGRTTTILTLRCVECGETRRRHLGDVRLGKLCGHRPPASPVLAPEAAAEELRGYGFEPLEPYPGTVGASWRCHCRNRWCRRVRHVTLRDARAGLRCKHQRGVKLAAIATQKGHGTAQ